MATAKEVEALEAAAIPFGATVTAPPAATRDAQPRRPWAVGLSALVPGLGSLALGRVTPGAWILPGWAIATVTLVISRGDLARTLDQGRLEDWVALATLAATVVGLWVWGILDVAVTATLGGAVAARPAVLDRDVAASDVLAALG